MMTDNEVLLLFVMVGFLFGREVGKMILSWFGR